MMQVLLLLLIMLGVLDAGFLSYTHLAGNPVCGEGSGCYEVLTSPYARVHGLPLSAIGMGAYLALAFCVWGLKKPEKREASARWIFFISLAGNLAGCYLLFLQAFVVGKWCPFCLFSTFVMAVVFLCILADWRRNRFPLFSVCAPDCGRRVLVMGLLLILPTLVFAGVERMVSASPMKGLQSPDRVVARMGDRVVTLREIDKNIRSKIMELEAELFKQRLQWLEKQLVKMDASQQGLSTEKLIKNHVDKKISVRDEEIEKFYRKNQSRLPKEKKEKLRGEIRQFLRRKKGVALFEAFLRGLKKKYHFRHNLPLPNWMPIKQNPRNGPEKGSPDARVTIVEFSDFQCPYCRKAHEKIEKYLKKYAGRLRLVFRHYPLDMHKQARPAAYAAVCAHQQGRFWPYADQLFRNQDKMKSSPLPALFLQYAKDIKLDLPRFQSCLNSKIGRQTVEADIREGDRYGIDSTPSFFINGYFISGFSPKKIEMIIDRELKK